MIIKKEGKEYTIKENKTSWTIKREISTAKTSVKFVSVAFNVPKDDCPNIDALKVFIIASGLF